MLSLATAPYGCFPRSITNLVTRISSTIGFTEDDNISFYFPYVLLQEVVRDFAVVEIKLIKLYLALVSRKAFW